MEEFWRDARKIVLATTQRSTAVLMLDGSGVEVNAFIRMPLAEGPCARGVADAIAGKEPLIGLGRFPVAEGVLWSLFERNAREARQPRAARSSGRAVVSQ